MIGKSDWVPPSNYNFAFKDDYGTRGYLIQSWFEFNHKYRNSRFGPQNNHEKYEKFEFRHVLPMSAIFPELFMFFFVLTKLSPCFLTNSDLQFQTKFEISGCQNQYSGNKMLQEPVKSRQDMSFTANTLQTCHRVW